MWIIDDLTFNSFQTLFLLKYNKKMTLILRLNTFLSFSIDF